MQTMIGLLDAEVQNQQLLHQLARKFISRLYVHQETQKLFLMIQFDFNEKVVLEKNIVAEW